MALRASFEKRIFHFNFKARTSRGSMHERASWFIRISGASDEFGIGEAGPLPGLSTEDIDGFDGLVAGVVDQFNSANIDVEDAGDLESIRKIIEDKIPLVLNHSSLTFAIETALLDLANGGQRVIFRNAFSEGKPIPINGLIWMGGMDAMLQQIEVKIQDGFKCIKMKVGGINFEKECDILQYVRRKYFRDNIIIRLDANGAFKSDDVLYKLNELSKYNIHSIEQPLKKGSPDLASLCIKSPIPIALDEEMIGIDGDKARAELLETIKPHFIVLKPSLHGGLFSCQNWIKLAEERRIGWWITSALESSIGLNSIAQFTAQFPVELHQGLGTGQIYEDNIESPLRVQNGQLSLSKSQTWTI